MVCPGVEAEGLLGDWFRAGCLSGSVVVLNGESDLRRICGDDVEIGGELCFVFRDTLLANVEVVDAEIIPGDELDWLPDAESDVARTPVPSVVVGSLAGVRVGGDAFFADDLDLSDGRQADRAWPSLSAT